MNANSVLFGRNEAVLVYLSSEKRPIFSRPADYLRLSATAGLNPDVEASSDDGNILACGERQDSR